MSSTENGILESPKSRLKEPMDPNLENLISLVLNQAAGLPLDQNLLPNSLLPSTLSQNQEALVPILDQLPYEDLWTCATVSKSWRLAASKTLKKWKLLKLRIHFIYPSDLPDPSNKSHSPNSHPIVVPRLSIKMATEVDADADVYSKFYESTTLENLTSKIVKQKKTSIWLILDLTHIPHYSTQLWDMVTHCFDLIRPRLSRLILDGSFEGWPFLSLDGEALDGPSNWMLLDSPNLRQIYFREILTSGMEPSAQFYPNLPLPPAPVQLMGVKTVRFPQTVIPPDYQHLIQKILNVAPKIDKLYNFPIHSVSLLSTIRSSSNGSGSGMMEVDQNAGHHCHVREESLAKIKSISYDLNLSRDPHTLLQNGQLLSHHQNVELLILSTISSQLRLQNLVMKWSPKNGLMSILDWKNCCETFSTILLSSRHTLRSLEIHNSSFAQHVNIPQMPSLITLILVGPLGGGGGGVKFFRNFAKGFELQQKFPNLNRLQIHNLHHDPPGHLDAMLPPDIFSPAWLLLPHQQNIMLASSVRELKIRDLGNVSNDILNQMAIQFPHVEVLDVGESWRWINECLPIIWTLWPKLRELYMEILWVTEDLQVGRPRKFVDQILTGIPEERCIELRNSICKLPLDLVAERKYPSIMDLKHLRLLSMSFLSTAVPLMSSVTLFYGFHLLPELQVILRHK